MQPDPGTQGQANTLDCTAGPAQSVGQTSTTQLAHRVRKVGVTELDSFWGMKMLIYKE